MKTFGLTALAALALTGASCATYAADMVVKAPRPEAMPPVSGYVELYTGWGRTEYSESDERFRYDGWMLGGAGRGTYWWSNTASLQLDAQAEGTSFDVSSGGSSNGHRSEHSYLIGGHASWRDARYLFGVFAAAGDASGMVTLGTQSAQSFRHGLIGLEGQAYLGPLTLYGQVGYDTTISNPLSGAIDNVRAWFVRGTGRYYWTPNTRLEGTVLYAGATVDFTNVVTPVSSRDFDLWLARAKIEHKLANSPFALFAAYEWSRTQFDAASFLPAFKVESQKVTFGVRLYINEKTLQWNDNKGTTLDIIDVLRFTPLDNVLDGTSM